MDYVEPLIGIAETAIALAGFTGVVVVFRSRSAGTWHPGDRLRLTWPGPPCSSPGLSEQPSTSKLADSIYSLFRQRQRSLDVVTHLFEIHAFSALLAFAVTRVDPVHDGRALPAIKPNVVIEPG